MSQASNTIARSPTDASRRRFLGAAAAASVVSVGALSAAALPAPASQCDAAVVAAGVEFEELMTKWVPVWFNWARLRREAQDETEAKFGEEDRDNAAWTFPLCGTSPASIYLMEVIDRNGCARAGEEDCAIYNKMDPLAELIREAEVTSLAGLRAKTLVSIFDFWPSFAGHNGHFGFDIDPSSHYSLFAAAAALTGLSGLVGDLETRLLADAGVTLRDGAMVTA
jgi:hypothetical protein